MRKYKKVLLIIVFIVLSVLSPFVVIFACGMIFCLFNLLNSVDFATSFSLYINWIVSLQPYYPYLTMIPIVAILLPVLLKTIKNK